MNESVLVWRHYTNHRLFLSTENGGYMVFFREAIMQEWEYLTTFVDLRYVGTEQSEVVIGQGQMANYMPSVTTPVPAAPLFPRTPSMSPACITEPVLRVRPKLNAMVLLLSPWPCPQKSRALRPS